MPVRADAAKSQAARWAVSALFLLVASAFSLLTQLTDAQNPAGALALSSRHPAQPAVPQTSPTIPTVTSAITHTVTPAITHTVTPTPTCGRVWAVATSPNITGIVNTRLNAVAALSEGDAWAVGSTVLRWDGLNWNVAVNAVDGELSGIAAVSANDVWAVGHRSTVSGTVPTTMHWDGFQWSLVPNPDTGATGSYLTGVAAVSSNDVWAVGYYNVGTGYLARQLIEHWDGAQWSIVASPNIGSNYHSLHGVAAISASDVWAVGHTGYHPEPYQTLIEHWDGVRWSVVTSPNPGDGGWLRGVSALSASDVWAVGSYQSEYRTQTLALRWDGSRWNIVTSPNPGINNEFAEVSVVSANDVWAVGYYGDWPSWRTLVEHWDGTRWSVVPSPNPWSITYLNGVASLPSGGVWAVGHAFGRTLVERWNGTQWSVVSSPNTRVVSNSNVLDGVTAVSANDMWAVGYFYVNGDRQALIEHWQGSAWNAVYIPDVESYTALYDVTAISANDIWAVGGVGSYRTLAAHWDGAQWSVVPSPNLHEFDNVLLGVAAVSADDVWAVGWSRKMHNAPRTLTLHWDGAQWSVIPSPNIYEETTNRLNAVAAISANNVWAVGEYRSKVWVQTLTMRWDGTQWNVIPSPNVDAHHNFLTAMTAVSENDMWAVGHYRDSPTGSTRQTLVEHWDGDGWSIVPSPNVPNITNTLTAVTAVSEDDVWAVGYTGMGYGATGSETLIMHWDGIQWSIVPSPNPGALGNTLNAVAAASPDHVWAVGNSLDPDTQRTLAAQYTEALSDVRPSDYFYEAVRYLYCRGVVSGYSDNTFRPYNPTTRAQLCKIIVLAEEWPIENPWQPHFIDVPDGHPFYRFVETAYSQGVISGYSDGTFRPQNDVTRAQLCKIVVLAEEWTINTQGGPHFTDVPPNNPFYDYIETAYNRNIVSGYSCGTGCLEFRPGSHATRGQICKVVYNAIAQP